MIKSSEEPVYFPFFSGHIKRRVPGQIVEFVQIFSHSHITLCESQEFSLLHFHDTYGNMILAEQLLEFLPRNLFSRPYYLGVIPPYGCRAFKIMSGKWNFICFFTTSDVQFLFHSSYPV